MVQGRSGPGFTLKALHRRRILFQVSREEFQRNVPAKIDILGFEHHAHTATAKLVEYAVV
jgi:hypothetical protein